MLDFFYCLWYNGDEVLEKLEPCAHIIEQETGGIMGFIKFILCIVAFFAAHLGSRRVRALGNDGASEFWIVALSVVVSFGTALFIYLMSEQWVYEYFYSRPERYETPLRAGGDGLKIYIVMLVIGASMFYHVVLEDALSRRSATIRRRRREARTKRRAM